MIIQDNRGVNFCTCLMCGTSFFFDKEDIKKDVNVSTNFPFVLCPHCRHEMKLGWNKDYFKHVKRNER